MEGIGKYGTIVTRNGNLFLLTIMEQTLSFVLDDNQHFIKIKV